MPKVALQDNIKRSIEVEHRATHGATVGRDLRWPDGSIVTPEQLRTIAAPPAQGDFPVTYWRLLREIPPNVVALAGTETAGLYVITGNGTSATRAIEGTPGEIDIDNGDGTTGNPRTGLADVTPAVGGSLQLTTFDAKGRRSHEGAATTDDLDEGISNLYFTDERAQDAVGAVLDDTGDVELRYEETPARRIWGELSPSVLAALSEAVSALQPGQNISLLNNDADYVVRTDIFGEDGIETDASVPDELIVRLSSPTVATISSALQPGSNISQLSNDSGYASSSDVVHKTGSISETITGSKTFSDGVVFLAAFSSRSANPSMQLQSETNLRRVRIRYNATDAADGSFVIQKWNGSAWVTFLEINSTTERISLNGQLLFDTAIPPTGQFTPTTHAVLNVSASSPGNCSYIRVGNVVMYSGTVNVTPTAAGTTTTLQVSIPVPSNFANNLDAGGSATAQQGSSFVPVRTQVNAANDRLALQFNSINTSSHTIGFSIAYPILP